MEITLVGVHEGKKEFGKRRKINVKYIRVIEKCRKS